MGGIFSCISDLARWVHGFAAAFPPGAEGAGGARPLRRATRREMQLPQVALERREPDRLPGSAAGGSVSYGFGLFAEDGPPGRIVHHAGGYPGVGGHMRWHPATGTGVIVLANGTYAAVRRSPPACWAPCSNTRPPRDRLPGGPPRNPRLRGRATTGPAAAAPASAGLQAAGRRRKIALIRQRIGESVASGAAGR